MMQQLIRRPIIQWCLILWFGMLFSGSLMAQDYPAGHQALEVWSAEGMANTPIVIKAWLFFMLFSFAAGLLFVWKQVEARWVVGGFILALLVTKFVLPLTGLVILSGLVALIHLIFWAPGLYLLLKRHLFIRPKTAYAYWCGLITAVIIISFVFDIRDAFIYLLHVL